MRAKSEREVAMKEQRDDVNALMACPYIARLVDDIVFSANHLGQAGGKQLDTQGGASESGGERTTRHPRIISG